MRQARRRHEILTASAVASKATRPRNTIAASLALFICGVSLSCHQDVPTTTWSSEAKSPDGAWTAIAISQHGGAYGGDYDITRVDLKRRQGTEPPVQVLRFSQNYPTMYLTLDWVSPTHLAVKYGSHASLDLWVKEHSGVKVMAEDISAEIPNSTVAPSTSQAVRRRHQEGLCTSLLESRFSATSTFLADHFAELSSPIGIHRATTGVVVGNGGLLKMASQHGILKIFALSAGSWAEPDEEHVESPKRPALVLLPEHSDHFVPS